ncbi:MAG: Protein with response regulator receiver domain [candidate division NC10 bacterium]|jgi:uncharacterized protein (TIGR02266 family)|nr:Protein with response regulator receiver domain [candidate division NC10 bacterium]
MADWRVLVADDEPYVVLAISEVLEGLPASVLTAHDGEEALRLARAERPDLILLDVKMPGLDGFQVATALKKDPATAGIPLVFFSALGAPSEKVRGLELGADDYVTKPIDAEELKARVRTILRRNRPSKRPSLPGSGQLQAVNLASLVGILEAERRTTRLLLARGDERGEIVFVDGHITRATQGPRQGEAAVYDLLSWQEGSFQMAAVDPAQQVGGEVAAPNQGLLLEAARRQEQVAGLKARLAVVKGPLRVPDAVRDAVARQSARPMAALVALLDGARALDQVLAHSPFDAWGTLKTLLRLLTIGALDTAAPDSERRGGLRLKVGVPIEYQSLGLWQESATFNLSSWGVFIRTATPFAPGENVILRFRLPEQSQPIRAMGRVVWSNTDPGKWGGTGMGIQFLELSTEQRDAIERHLANLVASQLGADAEAQ